MPLLFAMENPPSQGCSHQVGLFQQVSLRPQVSKRSPFPQGPSSKHNRLSQGLWWPSIPWGSPSGQHCSCFPCWAWHGRDKRGCSTKEKLFICSLKEEKAGACRETERKEQRLFSFSEVPLCVPAYTVRAVFEPRGNNSKIAAVPGDCFQGEKEGES